MSVYTDSMEHGPSREANHSSFSQKFPAFYGTLWFIASFTRAFPLRSQTNPSHDPPPSPTSWRCILKWASHLCLGLQSSLVSLGSFHQNPIWTSPISHICLILRLSHSSWFYQPNNSEEYRSLNSSLCGLLYSTVTSSFSGLNVFAITLFLNTISLFLPQCERPNFTPMQNDRQNYSSLYLHLYIFG
jgi:hypothetical protein